MEKNNIIKFRKVPVRALIDALNVMYQGGANYVDISGVVDSQQDMLTITVQDEYMENDDKINDDDKKEELTDEDLNKLLDL